MAKKKLRDEEPEPLDAGSPGEGGTPALRMKADPQNPDAEIEPVYIVSAADPRAICELIAIRDYAIGLTAERREILERTIRAFELYQD